MAVITRWKVEHTADYDTGETGVTLAPSPDRKTNASLWNGEPFGEIDMLITNRNMAEFFKAGHEYYIHFIEAL
jgi:hypothetical protein